VTISQAIKATGEKDDNKKEKCSINIFKMMMEKGKKEIPNIFNYATSELTQDAFICWLCEWSRSKFKEKNKALHNTGCNLIKSMLNKNSVLLKNNLEALKIKRQAEGVIDVIIELNNHVILIEDKVDSKEHSDQLERYKEKIVKKKPKKQIVPIYFQTGIQSNYNIVDEAGYKIFSRIDFLRVLNDGLDLGIKNDVYQSFHGYLKRMDKRFNSFENKKIEAWDWEGWQGFFSLLQKQLDDANWGYVANQSGGFMGFWWNFHPVDDCTIYMQLENDKLCYKISIDNEGSNYSKLRNYWNKKIIEVSQSIDLDIHKPKRFGYGEHMTVAVLGGDYRVSNSNKLLDQDKTIEKLKKAERVLNKVIN